MALLDNIRAAIAQRTPNELLSILQEVRGEGVAPHEPCVTFAGGAEDVLTRLRREREWSVETAPMTWEGQ